MNEYIVVFWIAGQTWPEYFTIQSDCVGNALIKAMYHSFVFSNRENESKLRKVEIFTRRINQ